MARWQFPDASAEVERLRVELEQARRDRDAERFRADVLRETALRFEAEREAARDGCAHWKGEAIGLREGCRILRAERDDLAARLQSIQQSERKYTAAKLTEAAKMRKGEAI